MVEPIMYLAIGFLVSMLLGLMIVPLVHGRAVRLTTKRLEAEAPLSIAEIQADKDHMRADFAMSTRRLELNIDRLRHKSITQAADIGRKTETIQRLQHDLEERAATAAAIDLRLADLKSKLETAEAMINTLNGTIQSHEASLADRQAEANRLANDLSTTEKSAEERQEQLTKAKSEIDSLTTSLRTAKADLETTKANLSISTADNERLTRELAETRATIATQTRRIADLDTQFTNQVTAAAGLTTKLRALDGDDHGQAFTELEFENKQLKQQVESLERLVRDLRVQVAASANTGSPAATEKLQIAKTALEEQLRAAQADYSQLQKEMSLVQREAEAAAKARDAALATQSKDENAMLREKINSIAAKVANLAMNLEGRQSTIGAILAADGGRKDLSNGSGEVTLADRIKALQAQVSDDRTAK